MGQSLNDMTSFQNNLSAIELIDIPTRCAGWRSIKIRANEVLAQKPEQQAVVLSFVLYPMLKWSLLGINIRDVITHAWGDEAEKFRKTQSLLASFEDCSLKLPRRDAYFAACQRLVSLTEQTWTELRNMPVHGEQMHKVLGALLTDPENEFSVSRYEIVTYFAMAIETIWLRYGDNFEELFDALIATSSIERDENVAEEEIGITDEKNYLFHNADALVKNYLRWNWLSQEQQTAYKNNIVNQLLHCKSPGEVLSITEKNSAICSANYVLQFLQLINGAVALVQYYPAEGKRKHKILRTLMTRQKNLSEADLAATLHMPAPAFSRLKKEAFCLLGVILWGLDAKALISWFVPHF